MILPVVAYGDPVLRKEAAEVTEVAETAEAEEGHRLHKWHRRHRRHQFFIDIKNNLLQIT